MNAETPQGQKPSFKDVPLLSASSTSDEVSESDDDANVLKDGHDTLPIQKTVTKLISFEITPECDRDQVTQKVPLEL